MLCRSKLWLGAAAFALLSGTGWAGDKAEDHSLELGSPIRQEALDKRRAGEGRLDLNLQETNATLHHNVAERVETGSNTITEGALRNASGLPVVVQNTGNNVIIQNAVILNLDVR
jgi:hypothetical protein